MGADAGAPEGARLLIVIDPSGFVVLVAAAPSRANTVWRVAAVP